VVRGHAATAERHGYTEWMYLLDEATGRIRVYEATVHDRWLPHSHHRLDPDPSGTRDAEQYQRGDRVVLEHTNDPHTRLRPGDEGIVRRHDQQHNTVLIAWDSGSTLAMLLDAGDRIRLIGPQHNTTPKEEQ